MCKKCESMLSFLPAVVLSTLHWYLGGRVQNKRTAHGYSIYFQSTIGRTRHRSQSRDSPCDPNTLFRPGVAAVGSPTSITEVHLWSHLRGVEISVTRREHECSVALHSLDKDAQPQCFTKKGAWRQKEGPSICHPVLGLRAECDRERGSQEQPKDLKDHSLTSQEEGHEAGDRQNREGQTDTPAHEQASASRQEEERKAKEIKAKLLMAINGHQ